MMEEFSWLLLLLHVHVVFQNGTGDGHPTGKFIKKRKEERMTLPVDHSKNNSIFFPLEWMC